MANLTDQDVAAQALLLTTVKSQQAGFTASRQLPEIMNIMCDNPTPELLQLVMQTYNDSTTLLNKFVNMLVLDGLASAQRQVAAFSAPLNQLANGLFSGGSATPAPAPNPKPSPSPDPTPMPNPIP